MHSGLSGPFCLCLRDCVNFGYCIGSALPGMPRIRNKQSEQMRHGAGVLRICTCIVDKNHLTPYRWEIFCRVEVLRKPSQLISSCCTLYIRFRVEVDSIEDSVQESRLRL